MKIGIVGSGNIGGNLTRRLSSLGHDVSVANSRGPESLADLAAETGATPASIAEVANAAELVIVAVPEKAVPQLPDNLLSGAADSVVVVDTGNYYPQRDGQIAALDEGQPASAWVADQLGRPVIKAFNNIYAEHLRTAALPAGTPGRVALPVAGDDQAAKEKVMSLIDELGFDPVDAGGLDESWRQQDGSAVYGTDLDADGVRAGLASAPQPRG